MRISTYLLAVISGLLLSHAPAQGTKDQYARAMDLAERTRNKVFRTGLQPDWLPDGRFWYRIETAPGQQETVLVDPAAGTREVLQDLSGLPPAPVLRSSALPLQGRRTRRTGPPVRMTFVNKLNADVEIFWVDPDGESKSYGRIAPGAETSQNTFAGHQWQVRDLAGETLVSLPAPAAAARLEIDGPPLPERQGRQGGRRGGALSPDGKYRVEARDHNLFLKEPGSDAAAVALTSDGVAENFYSPEVSWSPDSGALVATRVVPGQQHPVHMVDSAPDDQVEPKLFTHDYLKPGDELPRPQPVLIRIAERKVTPVNPELFPRFFTHDGSLDYRWQPDSGSFSFDYNQRGHQLYRIISVDRETAEARVLVEETAGAFIDYTQKTWRHFLDETGELIWMSERDGWCHLYLYDIEEGRVVHQITKGEWVVRDVESVDAEARQIWFMASGVRAGQDPYYKHLCRINMDGSGFVVLTEGEGSHQITFSPDRQFFIDEWSRPDLAPVTELRRASDGTRVVELERGDWTQLLAEGWVPPERFAAPGRDGKTMVYGTLIKPAGLDPAKSYPVLEEVYAGPHGAFAATGFGVSVRQHALAELGFVVVQVDGMGTNHRGRKFHEIAWKNLADAGFTDRIAWIRAAAASRPWMDLGRVGIYGGSAGGQSAMRALLDHHDFYKAAAADCGCHDNRMDKIWWNEQWLGWPVDDSYVKSSNVAHAGRLQGHLFLSVGELDRNVDPASTMQVVDALVKADKDFELLVMPGANHGAGEQPYAVRRRMDFFVRHLMGVVPRWQPGS